VSGVAAPLPPDVVGRARVRRRRRPTVVAFALGWLALVALLVIAGPLLAPHGPSEQDLLAGVGGPGPGHLLGTDALGRDILSRVMVGARSPVLGALAIALGAMLISVTLGLVAGYFGGWSEAGIMRGVDLLLALPPLLVIIVVAGAFEGGYLTAVVLLALLAAPWDTRIVRSVTLEQRPRAYVEAARVMGLPRRRVLLSHILPNIVPLIVVNLCLDFTFGLVSLAGLSFLGLGVSEGAADWGRMLYDNRNLLTVNPWAALAPALAILLTAAAANVAGDWAYEKLDAKGRAR
jgi:peptide/nickel transport system permease protein